MSFWEEGAFGLNDPIAAYLPELANFKVAQQTEGAAVKEFQVAPADHQPTIRELFTHTSGLTHCISNDPVAKMYRESGVSGADQTLAEMVAKLGKFPLLHQPGTVWKYGHSTDVLGRLLEVLSNKPLDQVLEERIFGPLGMNDTGFYVPRQKADRLYGSTSFEAPAPPKYLNPGGGLFSTSSDYLRFLQMLLNGGELGRERILGPRTVRYMLLDHLSPIVPQNKTDFPIFNLVIPEPGYTMSLVGFSVRLSEREAAFPGSIGSLHWHGSRGTLAAIDPKEQLAISYMAIYTAGQPHSLTMVEAMVHGLRQTMCLIYQAIDD